MTRKQAVLIHERHKDLQKNFTGSSDQFELGDIVVNLGPREANASIPKPEVVNPVSTPLPAPAIESPPPSRKRASKQLDLL